MGADFWRSVGGAFQQVPGRAANVAGLGVDAITTLNAIASRDPTALLQLQAAQAQALQDPTLSARAGSSPFFAGQLGLVAHPQPALPSPAERAELAALPVPARISRAGELATAPGRPQVVRATLPSLSPETQATQALQRAEAAEILRDPQAAARAALKIPQSPTALLGEAAGLQALAGQYPGLRFSTDSLGNLRFSTTTQKPALLEYPDAATAGAAGKAIGYAVVPTSRGTFTIRKPAEAGGMTVDDLNRLMTPQPPAPTPPPAPSLRPGTAPSETLPEGFKPFPSGPAATPPQVGFPSPAFRGAQTAPPPPGVPTAAVQAVGPATPAAPTPLTTLQQNLPSGARATIGPGGRIKSLTVTGPRAEARATETTDLANLTQAKAAIERIRQTLRRGASSGLTVLGANLLPQGGQFTGPVTADILRRSSSIRGDPVLTQLSPAFGAQPIDLQFRQLQADVNDVNLARFVVTGKRLTQAEISVFEGSLPNVAQPPQVFSALVERMAIFVDAMLNLKQALGGLGPAQREAIENAYVRATVQGWARESGTALDPTGPLVTVP